MIIIAFGIGAGYVVLISRSRYVFYYNINMIIDHHYYMILVIHLYVIILYHVVKSFVEYDLQM